MKRRDLLRHLHKCGCELLREGGNHSIWWNPDSKRKSSIPRHSEIRENIAKKIYADLGIAQT